MFTYIKDFLRHPVQMGSITPSSRFIGQTYAKMANLPERKTIVELGPGNGCITKEIVPLLNDQQVFFAIEINSEMVRQFRENCPDQTIYEGNLEDIDTYLGKHNLESCDCVISAIPWTVLPKEEREAMLTTIYDALEPGGVFLTIVYMHGPVTPAGRALRKTLEDMYADFESSKLVWKNVPPAYIYRCTKT